MKKKMLQSAVVLLLLFLSFASSASADQLSPTSTIFNAFDRVFGDFGETYETHGIWVDLVIYLFLFVFIARFALNRQQGFGEGAGKSLGVVIGIVLAIAATVYEANSGFRLGDIGPWALALALMMIAYIFYKMVHGMGFGGYQSAAVAFLVAYGFMLSVARDVFELLREKAEDNMAAAWGLAILDLFFIAAVIALVYMLITKVPKMFGQGASFGDVFRGGNGGDGPGPHDDAGEQGAHVAQREAQQAAQQQQRANLLQQHGQMFRQLDQQLTALNQAIQGGTQHQAQLLQQLGGAVRQLQQIDEEILQLLHEGQGNR